MAKPVDESTLPTVLFVEDLAALLGTSVRTIQNRRKSRVWPFTELPRIDRKPRWSKAHVNGRDRRPAAWASALGSLSSCPARVGVVDGRASP